nr:MAG TPA: hypothetical protein [Caudoviricetes sp.]
MKLFHIQPSFTLFYSLNINLPKRLEISRK